MDSFQKGTLRNITSRQRKQDINKDKPDNSGKKRKKSGLQNTDLIIRKTYDHSLYKEQKEVTC
jgi:hypothetical protein